MSYVRLRVRVESTTDLGKALQEMQSERVRGQYVKALLESGYAVERISPGFGTIAADLARLHATAERLEQLTATVLPRIEEAAGRIVAAAGAGSGPGVQGQQPQETTSTRTGVDPKDAMAMLESLGDFKPGMH